MFTKTNKTAEGAPAKPSTKSPTQDAIRGASSKSASRSAASIICDDMVINGSVTSSGALHIDGTIKGDVNATDITIGSSGHIEGEVKAEVVKVKGKIKGSIRARKVELETGAHVQGDILHASLMIQQNAVFEGQVKHADNPLKDTAPQAASSGTSSDTQNATNKPSAFGIPTSTTPS